MKRVTTRSFAAGLATVVLIGMMSSGADAGGGSASSPLKCKLDGTFFPPTAGETGADVLTTALGSCKKLGKSTHTGVLTAGTVPDGSGCVSLESDGPMVAFNKKGDSITYTVSGTQCLKDSNGQIPITAGFCGASTSTFTSTITATVTVTGGTGKQAGVTGTGAMSGTVNHCDDSAAFGNSFAAEILGTLQN